MADPTPDRIFLQEKLLQSMSRKSVQRFCDNDMHGNKKPKASEANLKDCDAL
ncbi:hypothetical protein [Rhizobium leguminosarum]|uniref:hypothetical protein n=1 Tax=Rhizobium leguminosarum TaxID=384 RepID=UPI0013E92042|nr:hypothetical protein [Rhizobium leguminosarum]